MRYFNFGSVELLPKYLNSILGTRVTLTLRQNGGALQNSRNADILVGEGFWTVGIRKRRFMGRRLAKEHCIYITLYNTHTSFREFSSPGGVWEISSRIEQNYKICI